MSNEKLIPEILGFEKIHTQYRLNY